MAKSKPIGVRFDLDKLDMIQKEQNLTSVQQVVNYLMDNYGEKEIKNMPIHEGNKANYAFKHGFGTITTKTQKTPPEGLKGIDLTIWKSENWE